MSVTAKVSSRAQTVLPKAVRDKLGLKPGDTIRFRETEQGIIVEKLDHNVDDDVSADPFATFTEWASPEEDDAWSDL